MIKFSKSFTQQEPIPADAIEAAVKVLESGRLHRYNTKEAEIAETALWEAEYAAYQGAKYCLATSSGGAALQIALRASGLAHGEAVLTNAFTLAPVPGAIAAAGGVPIFIETNENLTIDLDDLEAKLSTTGAKLLMLSHMRGHLAPMDELVELTDSYGVKVIEDCAHTMGAEWRGIKSGNFGIAACFSTQTYKHLNSGEGGLLTTDDDDFMARAIILSGSYMLYGKHDARPDMGAFEQPRFDMPNCSSRMDNLRASILRPQLKTLDDNIERWNARYRLMEERLSKIDGITMPNRPNEERYVASSIQFLTPHWSDEKCRAFVAACLARGVELKWFGDKNPVGFTSRFDSWHYTPKQKLDRTMAILSRVFDMRIPLIFTEDDCLVIAEIIVEEFEKVA